MVQSRKTLKYMPSVKHMKNVIDKISVMTLYLKFKVSLKDFFRIRVITKN